MAPRRRHTLLAFFILAAVLLLFMKNWQSAPKPQEVLRVAAENAAAKDGTLYADQLSNSFLPGTLRSSASNYTKTLVITRTKDEDVSWIDENLRHLLADGSLKTAIYVVDDPTAPLRPPKNKGHEVMVYLTYIIDHYDDLSDVNIFMHSHQIAWHNNELLENDAVQMVTKLSAERVKRDGYMNLRCHWIPGCPDWMHPTAEHESYGKNEEVRIAKSWSELFPLDPLPDVLAQPCCSQFAVSRDRLHSIPLARFVFYRDWLLHTSLSDYISGRVWEYLWQFVFTGNNVNCPAEHICYCDGYGICFGDEDVYKAWWKVWEEKRIAVEELRVWRQQTAAIQHAMKESKLDEVSRLEIPEVGRDVHLEKEIQALGAELNERKKVAINRGLDPKNRAIESGRQWDDGDSF